MRKKDILHMSDGVMYAYAPVHLYLSLTNMPLCNGAAEYVLRKREKHISARAGSKQRESKYINASFCWSFCNRAALGILENSAIAHVVDIVTKSCEPYVTGLGSYALYRLSRFACRHDDNFHTSHIASSLLSHGFLMLCLRRTVSCSNNVLEGAKLKKALDHPTQCCRTGFLVGILPSIQYFLDHKS